ncbi:MAG TPA: hypothetical protein VFF79_20360 [Conexibacter sp.]|nr:hypothetical protein [Conexibacter sp.]
MFQRIARRQADRSDEPVRSETAGERAGADAAPEPPPTVDAPTGRIDVVAPAPSSDQPTVVRPAAASVEQPTTLQQSVPPPAVGAPTPAPVPQPAPAAADVAAAAATPTGDPVPTEAAPRRPGFRARGRMRRRLRYLRRLRDLQVRDLGGLVFDLRRFERKRDDLVAQKVDQIRACDDELRALELALDERRDLRDVREPGIGGTCPRCFAVFGSADRFCANCGAALGGAVQGPAQVPLAHAPVAQPVPAAPAAPQPPATPPAPAAAPAPPAGSPEASGGGPAQ